MYSETRLYVSKIRRQISLLRPTLNFPSTLPSAQSVRVSGYYLTSDYFSKLIQFITILGRKTRMVRVELLN